MKAFSLYIDKKKKKKFENPITKNKKTKQNANFPAPPILSIKIFWLHLNENKPPVHMRYHLFLHYG